MTNEYCACKKLEVQQHTVPLLCLMGTQQAGKAYVRFLFRNCHQKQKKPNNCDKMSGVNIDHDFCRVLSQFPTIAAHRQASNR